MAKNCAEFQVVCSRVTLYYNCRIELKWKRALHHCEKCDFRSDSKGWGSKCGAIHFGRCTPVSFPFPQSYSRRKGSQQSGHIPVAKVSPTRPATYAPHSNPQHVMSSIMSLSHYHWYSTDVFLHPYHQEIALMLAFSPYRFYSYRCMQISGGMGSMRKREFLCKMFWSAWYQLLEYLE